MTFNAIIGNPPYQQMDGGTKNGASNVYQHFVTTALSVTNQYVSLITPARWFMGGKGLDDFRKQMLGGGHIVKLFDYECGPDIFPTVDIAGGVSYYLWDKNYNGLCEVYNCSKTSRVCCTRKLDEFETFIRRKEALEIVKCVLAKHGVDGDYLSDRVSPRKPFALPTNYEPKKSGVPCWFIQKVGLKFAAAKDVKDDLGLLNKWKLLVPKAPIAGQTDFSRPVGFYYDGNTRIAKPGECCTESWVVAGAFSTKTETESFKSYLFTKVVRFLILQSVISQDVTRQHYKFVPDLGKYEGVYTDAQLCERWGISTADWKFIDSRILAVTEINAKFNKA